METLPDMDGREKLNFELDLRLAEIWQVIEEREEREGEGIDRVYIGRLIRLAYGKGYIDALTEENSGQLLEDAPGFKISNRKR